MQITDIQPYIRAMEEIKKRVQVIGACLDGRTGLAGPPRIECAALQLRMVLELITLASLAANKDLYQQQSKRFNKHRKPDKIIRDLKELESGIFPCTGIRSVVRQSRDV